MAALAGRSATSGVGHDKGSPSQAQLVASVAPTPPESVSSEKGSLVKEQSLRGRRDPFQSAGLATPRAGLSIPPTSKSLPEAPHGLQSPSKGALGHETGGLLGPSQGSRESGAPGAYPSGSSCGPPLLLAWPRGHVQPCAWTRTWQSPARRPVRGHAPCSGTRHPRSLSWVP